MTDKSRSEDDLRNEAEEYVQALPDETAEGRLVGDDGEPADEDAWKSEDTRQKSTLNKPDTD